MLMELLTSFMNFYQNVRKL